MSIYVIDDHPLMRDAIVMVLRRLRPAENIVELERLVKLAGSVQQRGAALTTYADRLEPIATDEGLRAASEALEALSEATATTKGG